MDRKYRQFATDSRAATTIAADPPYNKNVRKTAASEKLIANRDLGKARLILGPTRVENARTRMKPGVKVSRGKVASASEIQITPVAIVIPLARFECFSVAITGGR